MVYELAVVLEAAHPGTATWLTGSWGAFLSRAFAPDALPTRLPQIVTAVLASVIAGVLISAVRARWRLPARRDQRGGPWWTVLATPFSGEETARYFIAGLWDLLRGGANVHQPRRADLSRRYAELLTDNLGQPGFRELLFLAHDLDARHDIVFALLGQPWRRGFFAQRGPGEHVRAREAVDLAGAAREVLLDGVASSTSLAGATDPTVHHLCAREPLARRDASPHGPSRVARSRARGSGERRRATGDPRHGSGRDRRTARPQHPSRHAAGPPRRIPGVSRSGDSPRRARRQRRDGSTRCS